MGRHARNPGLTGKLALRIVAQFIVIVAPPWLLITQAWNWVTISLALLCLVAIPLLFPPGRRTYVLATLLWLTGFFGIVKIVRLAGTPGAPDAILAHLAGYSVLFLIGLASSTKLWREA